MTSSGALERQLRIHEGVKLYPYVDTVGKLTIGVGRNLTDRGLSEKEVDFLLQNDIDLCREELDAAMPWWRVMSDNRQCVMIDMMFNLGRPRLLQFRKMLDALADGDYARATDEMLDSRWARQVGRRAQVLAIMMESDVGFEEALQAYTTGSQDA